jgi:hypothetical protein
MYFRFMYSAYISAHICFCMSNYAGTVRAKAFFSSWLEGQYYIFASSIATAVIN